MKKLNFKGDVGEEEKEGFTWHVEMKFVFHNCKQKKKKEKERKILDS